MTRWVLVVEDEAPLGQMICDNLMLDGHGAELVRDGNDALVRMQRGGVDLVILDIMLPGRDGLAVLSELRRRGDQTPVLILSARRQDADRIRGLELAADDYLGKPFHLRELLLRVGALLRRGPVVPSGSDLLDLAGAQIDFRSLRLRTSAGVEHALTATEARLLRLLAARPGAVVARREIVEHLFGPATPPTHRTLDNLVLNLRRHLEPEPSRPRHLHTVRGVGLRLTLEPEVNT
jgi:DNA-binding response OmpR family regulator